MREKYSFATLDLSIWNFVLKDRKTQELTCIYQGWPVAITNISKPPWLTMIEVYFSHMQSWTWMFPVRLPSLSKSCSRHSASFQVKHYRAQYTPSWVFIEGIGRVWGRHTRFLPVLPVMPAGNTLPHIPLVETSHMALPSFKGVLVGWTLVLCERSQTQNSTFGMILFL